MELAILDQHPLADCVQLAECLAESDALAKGSTIARFPNPYVGRFLQRTIVLWIYLVRIYTTKAPYSLGREA